jgi:hypothetical protein
MGALAITVTTHAGLFVWQAKYKERGTVLAEDQLAQVSDWKASDRKGDGPGLANIPLV